MSQQQHRHGRGGSPPVRSQSVKVLGRRSGGAGRRSPVKSIYQEVFGSPDGGDGPALDIPYDSRCNGCRALLSTAMMLRAKLERANTLMADLRSGVNRSATAAALHSRSEGDVLSTANGDAVAALAREDASLRAAAALPLASLDPQLTAIVGRQQTLLADSESRVVTQEHELRSLRKESSAAGRERDLLAARLSVTQKALASAEAELDAARRASDSRQARSPRAVRFQTEESQSLLGDELEYSGVAPLERSSSPLESSASQSLFLPTAAATATVRTIERSNRQSAVSALPPPADVAWALETEAVGGDASVAALSVVIDREAGLQRGYVKVARDLRQRVQADRHAPSAVRTALRLADRVVREQEARLADLRGQRETLAASVSALREASVYVATLDGVVGGGGSRTEARRQPVFSSRIGSASEELLGWSGGSSSAFEYGSALSESGNGQGIPAMGARGSGTSGRVAGADPHAPDQSPVVSPTSEDIQFGSVSLVNVDAHLMRLSHDAGGGGATVTFVVAASGGVRRLRPGESLGGDWLAAGPGRVTRGVAVTFASRGEAAEFVEAAGPERAGLALQVARNMAGKWVVTPLEVATLSRLSPMARMGVHDDLRRSVGEARDAAASLADTSADLSEAISQVRANLDALVNEATPRGRRSRSAVTLRSGSASPGGPRVRPQVVGVENTVSSDESLNGSGLYPRRQRRRRHRKGDRRLDDSGGSAGSALNRSSRGIRVAR